MYRHCAAPSTTLSTPSDSTPQPLAAIEALERRGHWGIKKGLDNIRALLAGLGGPEGAFPAVLIAGTNGKGSTGAFLAHGLRAAGLNVGWTTSPHLLCPAERIWIDGRRVDDARLDSLLSRVLQAESAAGVTATYFELIVAAAMLAFRDSKVDVALVEVGMGGRWDATNALDPILTVLTNVAMDHMEHLGYTPEAIATEKLCTARDGRPLVLGPGLDPAWLAPLCETKPKMVSSKEFGGEVFWEGSVVCGHRIKLAGRHQLKNLATALTSIEALRGLGWALDIDRVWEGFSNAEWPGRLWRSPSLPPNVVLDGAHNLAGAEALAAHLVECRVRPRIFFAAMGDKDMAGMARALASAGPLGVTVVVGDDPRWAAPEAMQEAWGAAGTAAQGPKAAGHSETPVATIGELALKLREESSDKYLVTGSLYFLGRLLKEMDISL